MLSMDGRLRERTAEELRVLLARRRMSASELARRAGMKQSTMSRRMTGETAFDLDDLERIAKALDVSVVDLIPSEVRPNERSASMPDRPMPATPASPERVTPCAPDVRSPAVPGMRRRPKARASARQPIPA